MGEQTLTQTITILIGENTLADTGFSVTFFLILALTLLTLGLTVYFYVLRRTHRVSFQIFHNHNTFTSPRSLKSLLTPLLLSTAIVGLSATTFTSATPTLTLSTNQQNLNLTVPKGGGTATTTTTITTSTLNDTGYTLTAALEAAEPGIGIELTGGNITANTPLIAATSTPPLTLKTTTEANSEDPESSSATDTTEATLTFTIDNTVTEGTKQLKLLYKATDNELPTNPEPVAPLTMQTMTSDYCTNHMTIYDGTNPSAILTLQDNRGVTPADYQTYEVAKLVDGNCWMLENLKLGSTTSSITLTPQDTDIASNFILPQVVATGDPSYDDPGAYGPIPGDTGEGATNYGYLYNWSAATAGESRASHDATAGDAPYSICAAGWRLPTGGAYDSGEGEFANLDRAFGGTGMAAWDGEPNIAKWQHTGPFKSVFSGVRWQDFYGQGDWVSLWTSSANPNWLGSAFSAGFSVDGANPGSDDDVYRAEGFSVRCLLN